MMYDCHDVSCLAWIYMTYLTTHYFIVLGRFSADVGVLQFLFIKNVCLQQQRIVIHFN